MNDFDIDGITGDPDRRIIVCCGSGGVGKTSTAAAVALNAAERHGRRVVVMTIDPAKRLAQALGLNELGNEPHRIEGLRDGSLDAMMLDMKQTFDQVVNEQAEPEKARSILANPFYQALSTTFSGTQEYMAMERLSRLRAEDRWDLIVVDTPPSRSALDFLDAPARLARLMDGPMIRMLAASVPGRPRRSVLSLMGTSAAVMTRVFNKVLGGHLLTDIAEFTAGLQDTFGGFRERADRTFSVLRSPETAFLVVAIPDEPAVAEAVYFSRRLKSERLPVAGLVLNQCEPLLACLSADRASAAAEVLEAVNPGAGAAGVLEVHAQMARRRSTQEHIAARFSAAFPEIPVREVPLRGVEIADLDGLREFFTPLHSPMTDMSSDTFTLVGHCPHKKTHYHR
ncbi:ArsA family ATPase [Haloglycomyces albus]|uniref:ArsA family ATPase n=1 Tax=Haloglycomyces albus TaxID=526067 RepID=UPI0004BAF956|nr:ArsA-related P-loop ATPase [Haloglycomyces albus]